MNQTLNKVIKNNYEHLFLDICLELKIAYNSFAYLNVIGNHCFHPNKNEM